MLMINETQKAPSSPPERLNLSHNYSTTPLLRQERAAYYEAQFQVIEDLLRTSQQDREQVYGTESVRVRYLFIVLLCNALNHRLVKAHATALTYIAHELPYLTEGLNKDDKNAAIDAFLSRGHELDELLGSWHPPVVTSEELPNWYHDYRRICETLGRADSAEGALALLIGNQNIANVELASQNRPFNWDATKEMDEAVLTAVRKLMPDLVTDDDGLDLNERNSVLKVARVESEEDGKVRFVMIPKKRLFAKDPVTGIEIYKRSSFFVDLHPSYADDNRGSHDRIKKLINQLIKVQMHMGNLPPKDQKKGSPMHNIHDAIASKISVVLDELLSQPQNERPDWLQPLATSYYALKPLVA